MPMFPNLFLQVLEFDESTIDALKSIDHVSNQNLLEYLGGSLLWL